MLSPAVGYAAVALAFVAASSGQFKLVREIARATGIPAPYLGKIIHLLARKGLVNTQRGIGGGVSLARPAESISMYDLCLAMDDPVVQNKCMLGTAECSDTRDCPAHAFWGKERASQIDFLKKMTVADVAAFETQRNWNAFANKSGHSAKSRIHKYDA